MNKRQATLHVLDFILVHVPVDSLNGFYEDPDTGEDFGEKDQERIRNAWFALYWQLSKRSNRLTKGLKVKRSQA